MLLRPPQESAFLIFVIIITFILITFSAWLSPKPFTLKPFGVNEIMQLLTLPFFISLLLERSLEVFITTWRGAIAEQLDMGIQQQNIIINQKRELIEKLENQISALENQQINLSQSQAGSVESTILSDKFIYSKEYLTKIRPQIDELNARINDLNDKERRRIAYKAETRTIALWTSLSFGLLISTLGVRLIEPLIVLDEMLNPIQINIFRCLDILLTGGLIAGGSEGIHKLIQVIIDFLEATSKQVKNQ